jgi:hypothetical protein
MDMYARADQLQISTYGPITRSDLYRHIHYAYNMKITVTSNLP